MKKAITAALAAIVLLIGGACAYRYFVLVKPLKQAVLDQLKDPDSAQFRNERYFGDWQFSHGVFCGEVNAKNGFGAFVGYRTFTADAKLATIDSEALTEMNQRSKLDLCNYDDVAKWWHLRW